MARCKDCIHEKVCMNRANIQTDTYAYMGVKYDTEKCEHYITADVVPKSEVARCKDCVYFQPDFVLTNNGERRPYTEEEKNSTLGMVTCDVGVNCGSRCERFNYWEDNRYPVWFQENDYCSYFKKKYT